MVYIIRWKPKSKYKAKAISIRWRECCTKAFGTDTLAEICGNATSDTPTHVEIRVCFSTKSSVPYSFSQHDRQAKRHTAKIKIVTESNGTNGGMSKRNSDKRFAFTLNEWICMGSSAHANDQTYKTKLKFFVILNLVTWYLYFYFGFLVYLDFDGVFFFSFEHQIYAVYSSFLREYKHLIMGLAFQIERKKNTGNGFHVPNELKNNTHMKSFVNEAFE